MGGSGAAAASTVGAGATPTAVASGTSVTVSWSASVLSNGTAVSGYVIKRYNASTLALQTTGSGCAGSITALTCTENAVPTGAWSYSVTPLFASNWVGGESAMSPAVVVDATPPTGTIDLTNGYQVGKYVPLTFTNSGGTGSVNAQLQRASAQFVNGACGTFSGWSTLWSTNPTLSFTDYSVSNAMCYQYRYVLTDSLGFSFTATTPKVAWVDYAGAVRYETPGVVMQWRLGDNPAVSGTAAADSVGTNVGTYTSGVTEGVTGELPERLEHRGELQRHYGRRRRHNANGTARRQRAALGRALVQDDIRAISRHCSPMALYQATRSSVYGWSPARNT